MKIVDLETFLAPPRWCFLVIRTDEGITGWGEPVVEGRAATVATAVHELSEYLVGCDPFRIERLGRVRLAYARLRQRHWCRTLFADMSDRARSRVRRCSVDGFADPDFV
jgi:L-alanine-DL-glutamate epimerase-like enolase superfamily enzyme